MLPRTKKILGIVLGREGGRWVTRMVLDCQRTEGSELPEGRARKMDQKHNPYLVSQNSSPFHDDTKDLMPSLSSLYWQPILCLNYSSLRESSFSGHISIFLMQVIIWWDECNMSQAQNYLKMPQNFRPLWERRASVNILCSCPYGQTSPTQFWPEPKLSKMISPAFPIEAQQK